MGETMKDFPEDEICEFCGELLLFCDCDIFEIEKEADAEIENLLKKGKTESRYKRGGPNRTRKSLN